MSNNLADSRKWKSLRNRINHRHSRQPALRGVPRFRTYVITVVTVSGEPPAFDFYVGETGKTLDERFARHMSGKPKIAAKIFRHDSKRSVPMRPGAFRFDLMDGFPDYWTREEAREAEAEIAQTLEELGFRVSTG